MSDNTQLVSGKLLGLTLSGFIAYHPQVKNRTIPNAAITIHYTSGESYTTRKATELRVERDELVITGKYSTFDRHFSRYGTTEERTWTTRLPKEHVKKVVYTVKEGIGKVTQEIEL